MFGLSAATLVSIALALLKFATYVIGTIKQEELIALGADREKGRAALAIAETARLLRESDDRIAALTDAEVAGELALNKDFRD